MPPGNPCRRLAACRPVRAVGRTTPSGQSSARSAARRSRRHGRGARSAALSPASSPIWWGSQADRSAWTSRTCAGRSAPYHDLLRRELERHGGTVEKFIGDAVMALFGAPVAHEDDPERAVRAALAIQDAIADLRAADERLDLHVRVGVNTGEALVVLDADPGAGEGMAAGDVVNTAARLQSAAPVDGVLVGDATHRATDRVIAYAPAEPVQAKGKAEPLAAWVAHAPVSALPEQMRAELPLVGREHERSLLLQAFGRAREGPAAQLVTLVGPPGIGKSRLVAELCAAVEEAPELVTWRRGRSLAYGEGVSMWALGEIVKAQAGILESDSAEVAAAKLDAAVAADVDDQGDRAWVQRHLRQLVGVAGGRSAPDERPHRGVRRLAALLRGDGGEAADRARLRRRALGRRRAARLHRPARRARRRGAASHRLRGPAGAPGAAPGVGRRQDQLGDDRAGPARPRRHRPARRRPARPGSDAGRGAAGAARAGRGQPALRAGVRAHAPGRRPAARRRRGMGAARRDRGLTRLDPGTSWPPASTR